MNQPNKVDRQFAFNLAVWGFFALQAAIGICTSIYWIIWLLRDQGFLD